MVHLLIYVIFKFVSVAAKYKQGPVSMFHILNLGTQL